ncbi:hypothetical protein [Halalkalibacterium ligniniphilum]|uniref:hypothetical protein n=1 Tax=Halalkalibacterium ligniniphilum TaxID=1134413 RepID=UPI000348D2DE|nr:hypothetical protein [Halalkalibacterium ligniniphilum]
MIETEKEQIRKLVAFELKCTPAIQYVMAIGTCLLYAVGGMLFIDLYVSNGFPQGRVIDIGVVMLFILPSVGHRFKPFSFQKLKGNAYAVTFSNYLTQAPVLSRILLQSRYLFASY